MDAFDVKLLATLQQDSSLSINDVAERIGLSPTPCWRRIKRLEEEGYIRKRVAILDPIKLGLSLTAFVLIKTDRHNHEWLERFRSAVAKFPEVVEIARLAGEYDYLLKVITRNNQTYDAFYKRLIAEVELSNVTSSFSMEDIKSVTELPLEFAGLGDAAV
ncbi:MAG: Lrp/AsnC family transcriptional regulator [Salinarimonas sp.]|nr:Lrp/AsnC family transcriptional regulator [Salinarimonas sp.]